MSVKTQLSANKNQNTSYLSLPSKKRDFSCGETIRPGLQTVTIERPLKKRSSEVLHIEEIHSSEEAKDLLTTLSSWKEGAEALLKQAQEKQLPEIERYESSIEAAKAFIRAFSNFDTSKGSFLYVCFDRTNTMQGCMLLTPSYLADQIYASTGCLVIDLIMTNPSNIPSPLLETAIRISGVGTALIRKAEMKCESEQGEGLILKPDPSCIEFYKKNDFKGILLETIAKQKSFHMMKAPPFSKLS
jgi:hypothetical protein